MIELGGQKVLRVFAKHEPYPGHLAEVARDMADRGAPTIACVEWRGELFAIEGSHRLAAAHAAGLIPTIVIVDPERVIGDDDGYLESLRPRLPAYSWVMQ